MCIRNYPDTQHSISKEVLVMAKKTMCSVFMHSLSQCKECLDNGLCLYHSTWIKTLIKIYNCKPYKLDGCEACEERRH